MNPSARTISIRTSFGLGGSVYLRARPERLEGLVTGLIVRPGSVAYVVAWGDATESNHYDFELSDEPAL